jgi:hypothetical protein
VTDAPPPSAEDWVQAGKALEAIVNLLHGLRAHIKAKSDPAETLHLIAEFFASVEAPDVAEHVGRIAMAFYDRADGIDDPLLERPKKSKRNATQVVRGRMWTALGFECLQKMDMSKPKAVEHVERSYPAVKRFLKRKGANLAVSLPKWHNDFMNQTSPQGHWKSFRTIYDMLELNNNPPGRGAAISPSSVFPRPPRSPRQSPRNDR